MALPPVPEETSLAGTVQGRLLREHRRVLELVARGERPVRCLQELCFAIEHVDPSVRVCIVLVSTDGTRLTRVIAPQLPELAGALRRLPEGETSAAACAPVVRHRSATCADVSRDPEWPEPWKSLFQSHAINAVHSSPIGEGDSRPRGSVLLCLEASRKPAAWGSALADMASGVAAIILAREESEEALTASRLALAAELELARHLQAVSTQLIQADDVESLYDKILDTAVAIMQSDFASLQMLYPERGDGGELQLLGHRGFDPGSARFWEWVRPASGTSCGVVLRTGRRCVVPDVEQSELEAGGADLEAFRRAGIRATQTTPLYSRSGAMLGMISNHWGRPHTPSDREFRALDVLARQAADVIERLRAEEALREANRHKDEFLAMLAHELRNPIAPLRNALEVLKHKASRHETAPESIVMMERQIEHIRRLVDDLLDVSRVSRGTVELRNERVELAEILQEAADAIRPVCESMDQRLTVSSPREAVWLHGDRTRLAQVLQNLLHNACKFTPRGGCISVTAAQDGDETVVRIKDSGSGIAAEQLPHIFDMFMQADTSLTRAEGGLGIGLTLVKNLVTLHGGTIAAESAGIGHGSEFIVRLPVAEEVAEEQGGAEHAAPAMPPEGVAPRRILVVDDNRDAADSLVLLLKLQGHDVHAAYDGQAAVDAAVTLEPDAILLDIGLPGLDGYEAARRIRELRPEGGALLVALTGWGQENDRRNSAAAGFDHHLVKPVDLHVLEHLLATRPE